MANDDFGSERDRLGELQVPADALWGAQTQRAVDNFPISGLRMPRDFIRALGLIKWAAATANVELGGMDAKHAAAIQKAALEVANAVHDRQFPVDIFQSGSGSASNANANEVIARLASQFAGIPIQPDEHVDMSQSAEDVIPTAIQLSALLGVEQHLLPALAYLSAMISRRIGAVGGDAGHELSGWRTLIEHGSARIMESRVRLQTIALGTAANALPRFSLRVSRYLSVKSGLELKPCAHHFEALSVQESAVELSGQLRTLAVSMMKIANDLRGMNRDAAIPEAVTMVAAQVMGNDATIAVASSLRPVVAYNLLQSIDLLSNAARVLAEPIEQVAAGGEGTS